MIYLDLVQQKSDACLWYHSQSDVMSWLSLDDLVGKLGPIMVNLATYIGSNQAGFLGAVVATLAVVLPSFLIILLVTALLKTALKNKYVQAVLCGLKPCVIGIVLATGIYMVLSNCFVKISDVCINIPAIIISIILVLSIISYRQLTKKKLSPILLMVISAVAGVVVYGI